MLDNIDYNMSEKIVNDDEITDLEREIIYHRIQKIDEQEECTVEEALDKLD